MFVSCRPFGLNEGEENLSDFTIDKDHLVGIGWHRQKENRSGIALIKKVVRTKRNILVLFLGDE